MKHTMKKALSFVLALTMILSCMTGLTVKAQAAATSDVSVEVNGNEVVIGNGYISREFSTAGGKLSTTEINNKRANEVFAPAAGSEEFIIRVTKAGNSAAPAVPALDRTGWTAVADSYHNASGPSDGPGQNLLDGNLDSIWHTNYGGGTGDQSYPYEVVIDLAGEKTFSCFSYTPRQQGEDTNGNIKGYELYYTTDGTTWELASKGDFKYEGVNPIYVNLDAAITATKVKLVATSAKNGQSFAGGAEFNLHAEKAPVAVNDREFAASALELAGEPVVANTTATINNVEKTGKMVTFNFKPYEFKGTTYTISEVIVMYNGDHFMRKYMEIEVDNDQTAIDYIDLESLKVNADDAQWTIPHVGGIVQMSEFKANLGQPIYIQGMFFGCEFPETDNQIEDGTGHIRYYTGKNFARFEADNQLTTDGKYVTWQTVAGAARSTDNQVIQADFYEYIYSIATPSEFRIQYNSWFDNMMLISDENILETFIEFDQEMNKVEVRPLNSYVVDDGWINYNHTYVVDANRAGTTLNKSGFWEFNSKFPNELYPSSELANKFGSNFGLWVGPRGGYNFYGSLADIIAAAGKGSKAGGSIDVASRVYVKNLTNMFCDFQDRFQVNYWKWDGFADGAQYGAFPAADGVPGYANDHMTGGYQNMYHVTDLWEAWIDLMEAVRANGKENNIPKLWMSLTCYVNPSPWFLQWANSVWMQCTHDQKDANFGLSKMDKQMTYRDSVYYDFLVNHEFQFPLANLYNHDPVYGKEGTGMNKNNVTDEDFQNYLYMQSTRGTAFWELYFSDSLMNDEKYEITGEFLEWAEENSHILRNAKMIGGMPDRTFLENASSNEAYAEAYGFSCFDGNDGIISIRNPHSSQAKEISFTFDRIIGVPEDAGTLDYYMIHSYRMPEDTALTGEFTYGETYTFTLQPNEVRMFQISKGGDTTAPKMERAFTDGDKVITVRFNEKVIGNEFTVSGATVESVAQSADNVTYRITLTEAPENNSELTVTADVTDISGNACENSMTVIYNADNLVTESLQTNYGFSVSASTATTSDVVLVSQGDAYKMGINAEGKAYFTVNGATAVSDVVVAVPEEAEAATIIGVKENNGILKIYVNGTLAGAEYKAENRYFNVPAAEIVVSELATKAAVYDIAFGYDELNAAEAPESTLIEGITGEGSSVDTSEPEHDKSVGNAFDGDIGTFWATDPAAGTLADAYLIADLGEVYDINQVDYTKRFDSGALYACTGNLLDYVIEVSTDKETWTEVAKGDTVDGTTEIKFEPVAARYVKLTATKSHHWKAELANTVMTVAELAVHKYVEPIDPNDPWGKSKWVKIHVDTETIDNESEGNFEYAWDNDKNTRWHSNWKGAHDVLDGTNTISGSIDFTREYKINRFSFLPRQDDTGWANGDGVVTMASLYKGTLNEDGTYTWEPLAEHVEFEHNQQLKTFTFPEQNVRYIKFVAERSVYNGWVAVAEFELGYEKPAAHKHAYGEWTETKAPTCTEKGEETRSCECGETETRAVDALGHDFGEWTETKAPTCTEKGEETRTCSRCNETETQEIAALDHNYVDGTCTNCGEAETPAVSEKITGITGEGSSVDTSEPAYNKDVANAFDGNLDTFWATVETSLEEHYLIADLGGEYTIDKVEYTKRHHETAGYNCTGNLLNYIIEVSLDGQTWTEIATGETVDGTTEITFEPVKAAYVRLTATESYHWQDGTNGQPDNSDKVMTVAELAVYGIKAPHEHAYGEWTETKAPTCTEDGSKERVCECGEKETDVIPATGHSFGEWSETKAPTCEEKGEETRSCACGESETRAVDALGHDYVDGVCTRCGDEEEEVVDPTDPWGKGKWVRVDVDSETIYSATEGNFEYAWDGDLNTIWHSNWQGGHDVLTGENTISGTIDFTKAYLINQFSFTNRQDDTDFPSYITQASLYVKENESDEWTCVGEHVEFEATKEQKTFYFEEQNVRYVKFVAEKSSNMNDTNGRGETQGWVCIAEFDINYVPVEDCQHPSTEIRDAKAATCTEDGYTGDTYCKICHVKIAEGEVIDATGHVNTETRNAKEATCTEDGYTGDTYCKDCGEKIAEGKVIEATGHTFGDWNVTKAPTCTEKGTETRTCKCGETETRDVDALGHKYKNGKCERCGDELESKFEDVKADKFYFDAVEWAVEKKITEGMPDGTFAPTDICTRGQVVTFLWRAAGSPAPKSTEHPFTDVKEGKYYYEAMLWAVENGITKGMTTTTFAPDATCTRAQVVTFLWRAKNMPKANNSENPFTDVTNPKAFYYEAMLWAVENEITTGVTSTTFAPDNDCTRGHVVTFLYRAYK